MAFGFTSIYTVSALVSLINVRCTWYYIDIIMSVTCSSWVVFSMYCGSFHPIKLKYCWESGIEKPTNSPIVELNSTYIHVLIYRIMETQGCATYPSKVKFIGNIYLHYILVHFVVYEKRNWPDSSYFFIWGFEIYLFWLTWSYGRSVCVSDL